MKKKKFKFFCFLISVMMILSVMNSMIWAIDEVVDKIEDQFYHDHNSCLYSCEHSINIISGSYGEPTIYEEDWQYFLDKYMEISSEEEIIILISKLYGIPVEDFDFDFDFICSCNSVTEPLNEDDLKFFREEGGCIASPNGEHDLLVAPCSGNHGSPNSNCMRFCTRSQVCLYYIHGCNFNNPTNVYETAHTWSVGWCGQTCKICGLIQLFHAPGGCWYCS